MNSFPCTTKCLRITDSFDTCMSIHICPLIRFTTNSSTAANTLQLQSVRDLQGLILRDSEKRAHMNNNK
jgi:hypothetical protein